MAEGDLTYKVVFDTSGVSSGVGAVQKGVKDVGSGVSSLNVLFGSLGAQLVGSGISKIQSFFGGASDAANQFENSLLTLGIVSERFGVGADDAKNKAKELGDQLRVGTSTAASGLMNLMKSGLNLDQASELMKRFTNEALTGKDANISLSQAVENLTQMYMTEMSSLGNMSGISENMSYLLQKEADARGVNINSLSEQGREQLKYDAFIRLTNQTLGSSEQLAGSLTDKQAQLGLATQNAGVAFGQVLNPMVAQLTSVATGAISSLSRFFAENRKGITTAIVFGGSVLTLGLSIKALIGVFGFAAQAIQAFAAKAFAAQLRMGVLAIAVIALSAAFASAYEEMASVNDAFDDTEGGAGKASNAFKDFQKSGVGAGKAVGNEMGKTADRIKDIRDAIREETEEFNKQVADIIMARERSLADNKKNLDKETKEFEKKQKEQEKTYKQKTEDQKKENTQRLQNVEQMMGGILVKGSATYNEDLQNYQEALAQEKRAGEDKLQAITEQYNQDKEEAKTAYDEKTNYLVQKIQEDEAFLRRHAEEVKGINRNMNQDELDQLKQKHAKRLADLQKQLTEEHSASKGNMDAIGADWGNMVDKMNNKKIDVNKIIKPVEFNKLFENVGMKIWGAIEPIARGIVDAIFSMAKKVGGFFYDVVTKLPLIGDAFKNGVNGFTQKDMFMNLMDKSRENAQNWISTGNFASGTLNHEGGWAMVGERGPEMVQIPRGSKINTAGETSRMMDGSGKNITVNNYFSSEFDIDNVNNKMMYQLRTL